MADPFPLRSLESLKNEARRWLKQLRNGDSSARLRFDRALPRFTDVPSLRDVQHALAREHGFPGWKHLADAARMQRIEGARSLAYYEAAAEALLEAYRTGTPEAMERHYRYTWHRRAWGTMRTYVQLDLGKRPVRPGADVEITFEDAQYLVAVEHGFASWDELGRFTHTAPAGALATAKPVQVVRRGESHDTHARGARDWDTVVALLRDTPSAELHANGQMTDAALGRIARVGTVAGLTLCGSRAVTDEGLAHLAQLPGLVHLDLSGTSVSDRGLEVLRHLMSLQTISLGGTRVTDAGAVHLAHCPALERVNLSWTHTGDGALRALAGKPHLRELTSGIGVTDAGLPLLHELPQLKTWQGRAARLSLFGERVLPNHLSLRGAFTDAGLKTIRRLDGLFSLDLDDSRLAITAGGLASLIDLPHLAVLAADARDDWMPVIAAMASLRALVAQDTVAGDDGFAALSRSRSLEYLWGRRCHNLRRRGFTALADIPTLRGLSVSCLNVDDRGLARLPDFPALEELMPMDVPDEGYRHIAACPRLASLILMYCRNTTDHATERVRNMRLRSYFNSYTMITDRTPEVLSSMDSLERITFDACHGLTDAGVSRLARLPRLRKLRVAGRGLTPAVVQPFASHVKVFYGG